MKKFKRYIRKAIRNFRKTFLNKFYATILFVTGWFSTRVSNDATAFVFLLMIAVPLFLAKENYIIK